jgi:hypothetical protein
MTQYRRRGAIAKMRIQRDYEEEATCEYETRGRGKTVGAPHGRFGSGQTASLAISAQNAPVRVAFSDSQSVQPFEFNSYLILRDLR